MANILLSHYTFHEDWAQETMKQYIKPTDRVAVIPFSFRNEWIKNKVDWDKAYEKDKEIPKGGGIPSWYLS